MLLCLNKECFSQKCSNPNANENLIFCSRCGTDLAIVEYRMFLHTLGTEGDSDYRKWITRICKMCLYGDKTEEEE